MKTLNRLWAVFFLGMSGVPWRVQYQVPLNKKQQYVICANHFSILDIVTMGFLPLHFIFVGKSSLAKIPVFGFMFRRLHITVDRSSRKDSYRALQDSLRAVDDGNSLVMFPEGGVLTTNPPCMVKFKDGPFRVAIEKQIPILPVTIPYNWFILPDDDKYLLYPRRVELIVHEAIATQGLTIEDLPSLKNRVQAVIAKELKQRNKEYEDRFGNLTEDCAPGPAEV
jgi:1-acyl-sn-glycerol-3-phosphate acyltransferase